ncbi:hypothetical protein PLESTB_001692800 [Pleodorina starrii]|uniref:DUF7963 domain-containing protein n=1 Tax=Pleodorina starrii TaxID=330485 RepID=A0A9W6BZA2_9CHLO|nr:hypothetical protein PLESTB_001692800 [Pleodorina starrii]
MADSGAGPSKTTTKKDTYTYGPRELDAAAYCEALKGAKAKNKTVWWSYFSVHLLEGVVKLKCTVCGDELSAKNPSVTAPTHLKRHERAANKAETIISEQKLIYIRQNSRALQKGSGGAHDEEVMMKLIEGLEVQE